MVNAQEETKAETENEIAIFGPPGTGKTTRLLDIMEKAIADGIVPERIAFLSFTRKAANEAIFRAVNKFKIERKEFKWFRTLHSLAYQFLGCTHTDIIQDQDFEEFKKEFGVDISNSINGTTMVSGRDPDGIHLIDLYRVKNTTL